LILAVGDRTIIALTLGLLALLVLRPLWKYGNLRDDSKLTAAATAAALQKKLTTPYGFRCKRQEEDASLALDDVDYFCEPKRMLDPGYWVGTNGSEITGLQPTG
jgi:hypothetical protein